MDSSAHADNYAVTKTCPSRIIGLGFDRGGLGTHGEPRVIGASAQFQRVEEHGTVVGDMLRGLEVRFPGLASWLGGRGMTWWSI